MDTLEGVTSTLALRRLSATLRAARTALPTLRVADVAKAAGLSQPRWSQVENGQAAPTEEQLLGAISILEIEPPMAEELLALRARTKVQEWWYGYKLVASDELLRLIGYEAASVRFRHCASGWVPGLLQTEDVARAIFQTPGSLLRPENVPLAVELRKKRSQVLEREDFRYHAVCGEEALRYMPGGRDAQIEQLDHLLKVIEANDRLTLQVTAFGSGRLHMGHSAPYSIFDFAHEADRPVVQFENTGVSFSDKEQDLRRWSFVFDDLTRLALSPGETVELIGQIIKELRRGRTHGR